MHIAVIGAGAAGLAAIRHAQAADGVRVTCFEQTGSIGGTWVLDDRVGLDEFGVPISSSMYHNLVTNGCKEIMAYPDIPFAEQDASYLPSASVLDYLEKFAADFQLHDAIKLRHQVLRVQPVADTSKWQIAVRNVITSEESTAIYDAVMVCNGHNSAAAYPEIGGRQRFRGQQMHSHDYRRPQPFAGKSVLVIGIGPSGIDIGFDIKAVAAKVCVSHHEEHLPDTRIPTLFGENASKPDVVELTERGARFADNSEEEFDIILYCTGYIFKFPFLAKECGIEVTHGHVETLYKHCVNIARPTMFLIGLTTLDLPFVVMDVQVRFCLALLQKRCQMPDGESMQRWLAEDLQQRARRGFVGRSSHKLFETIADYLRSMTDMAQLEPVRPVLFKMFQHGYMSLLADFTTFRREQFTIVDSETFTSRFPADGEQ